MGRPATTVMTGRPRRRRPAKGCCATWRPRARAASGGPGPPGPGPRRARRSALGLEPQDAGRRGREALDQGPWRGARAPELEQAPRHSRPMILKGAPQTPSAFLSGVRRVVGGHASMVLSARAARTAARSAGPAAAASSSSRWRPCRRGSAPRSGCNGGRGSAVTGGPGAWPRAGARRCRRSSRHRQGAPVRAESEMSRAAISTSDSGGMPATLGRFAAASPMTPGPVAPRSSAWSKRGSPVLRARTRALRIRPPSVTGKPSSENAAAPAAAQRSKSVSSAPFCCRAKPLIN